jgi:hypothetical protein
MVPRIDFNEYLKIFDRNINLLNRDGHFKRIVRWFGEGESIENKNNTDFIRIKFQTNYNKTFTIKAIIKQNDILSSYEGLPLKESRYWYLDIQGIDVFLFPPVDIDDVSKDEIIDYGITPTIYYERYYKYMDKGKSECKSPESAYRSEIRNEYIEKIFMVFFFFFFFF